MAGCPICGEANPERAKFCLECGASLNVATTFPREERKVVSVLFCDLVGFTATSEASDPEDVQRRLDPYHGRVREEIERFGGTVDKYIGDAVMAVFGIPVVHEDDAERAVRTGLAVLEAIDDLNAADPGLELRVRIGVNTGEALVTMAARPETGQQWMVSGDVINTASRLQSIAPVGSVVVSAATYRRTEGIFEYEALEPVQAKGKAKPLALWRARAARGRFGSDVIRTHTSPFVGRELEKPLLIGTFERSSQGRSVQLVTIVGEPGVGKSRLVAELFSYVDSKHELVTWRQGRCLPYGEGITFWALGEIVKAHTGIFESDPPEAAETKLEAVLPDGEDRPWLRARLLPLLGIDSGQTASREESFTAWRRFLESIASVGPAVIVVEDLHWGDPALLDFITHLAEWAEGVPLLVLCTARPELYERHPGWAGGMRNATTINLPPLSERETAELVSALLAHSVGEDAEQAIRERSGGNPLYAEEFVRLIADRGLGETGDELAFPDSLQALIAARLDTLPADRKSLLQDAAVLGKVFWAGALAEMGGREPQELEQALHELTRKELIRSARTSSMEGEVEYSFWHLLVRDIAYAQIPRRERIRRHRAAARWIEQKAGARVEDLAELLAHHYLEALDQARAAGETDEAAALTEPARRFLTLAGERALGLDAVQAEARLARALELWSPADPARPKVMVRWVEALFNVGQLREAAAAADEALAAFREQGDDQGAARAIMLRSSILFRFGDRSYADLAAEAVSVLERAEPSAALVDAYSYLTTADFLRGDYDGALAASEHALALAEQLGLPEPARALAYRGAARADLGEREGITEMERAAGLFIASGSGRDAAGVMNNLALARLALEGPAATLSAIEEAVDFCRRRGLADSVFIESESSRLLLELGRTAEALEAIGRMLTEAEVAEDKLMSLEQGAFRMLILAECGDENAAALAEPLVQAALDSTTPDRIVITLAAVAEALRHDDPARTVALLDELGRTPGAHETPYYARQLAGMVRTALAVGDPLLGRRLSDGLQPLYPLHEHALCAARAQLAEADGEHDRAEVLYAEAAERWQDFGVVPERAYALLGRGRCLFALGDMEGAPVPLAEARELFESMGYRPALAATEALLAEAALAVARVAD